MAGPGGAWRRAALVLLLAAAGVLASARETPAAVDDYLGRPVIRVRFEVEGVEAREPTLFALAETRIGEPLRLADVRETIGHLFSLRRYEDVQARATLEAGGVALVYALVPLRHVQALEFRGRGDLAESLLREAVADRLGPSPAVGRAADAARVLEELYRDHGYRHAQVTADPRLERRPDRTTLVFGITPGPPTRVGLVDIKAEGRPPGAVLGALNLRRGDPFRQGDLDARLAAYREGLQAQGYYEARVNYLPRFSDDELTVDVTILVETGPLVRIRFDGDGLPERERETLVPVAREHSVDEDLLEDSKRRIESRLRDQGFRDALAEYRREEVDGTLTVVFTVTRGPLHRLDGIEISGSSITPQLQALVRLRPGEPFVDAVLSIDVARMAELYRRQGYAEVAIDTAVSSTAGIDVRNRLVTAVVTVDEGVQSFVEAVAFEGNQAMSVEMLRAVAGLTTGEPFFVPRVNAAADAIAIEYADRGYQNVNVVSEWTPAEDRRMVDVTFRIAEGPQIIVDQIIITGNTRTRADIIENELRFRPGEPLGQRDIVESYRRLAALGLFRRTEISQIRHPGEQARYDVLVTVEEAPATTFGIGGGPEGGRRLRRSTGGTGVAEERIEFGARGFFEIGRRNMWGKNRAINLFGRVSFRPKGESVAPFPGSPDETTRYGFNEYRMLLTYREPRVFGMAADGQLSGVLEQGIRSSFNFSRRVASFEVGRRLSVGTSLSSRYALEQTRIFDEQPNPDEQPIIDRLFPQIRLSSFSSTLIHDTRPDPLDPVRGSFATVDGAVAARAIGSEVGFVKTLVKTYVYWQLPRSPRLVFAGGGTLGLARGFPIDCSTGRAASSPVCTDPLPTGDRIDKVTDLPASERFYAGGDTTVRGFALDRLGTRETIDEHGFPTGGHALLIFNAELRARLWGDLGAVGFMDVGNVFARASAMDLGKLRGSVGVGVRYGSPVGPIRVDLGFKLSRFRFLTGRLLDDGVTPETRLEPLTALHISLGQSF